MLRKARISPPPTIPDLLKTIHRKEELKKDWLLLSGLLRYVYIVMTMAHLK